MILNSAMEFEYAKNGGVVSTMVLVYQALHDYFHFCVLDCVHFVLLWRMY